MFSSFRWKNIGIQECKSSESLKQILSFACWVVGNYKKNIFLLNGDEFHGRKKTHITLNKQKIMESQPNPSQRTLFNETNWYILYIQEQMTNDYISWLLTLPQRGSGTPSIRAKIHANQLNWRVLHRADLLGCLAIAFRINCQWLGVTGVLLYISYTPLNSIVHLGG